VFAKYWREAAVIASERAVTIPVTVVNQKPYLSETLAGSDPVIVVRKVARNNSPETAVVIKPAIVIGPFPTVILVELFIILLFN
jgi:hypothetical protein